MDNGQEIERFKAQLQIEVKRFEADLSARQATWQESAIRERERWLHELRSLQSMFAAIVEFALITIRSLILVNGGAIIGIVSFTGNLWSRGDPDAAHLAKSIAPAITFFVVGLALALITAGLAYVSQVVFAEAKRPEPAHTLGNRIRAVAVACAIFSLCAFIGGAYESIAVFRSP